MRWLFIGGPAHGKVMVTSLPRVFIFDGDGPDRRYHTYFAYRYLYRCVMYPLMVCDPNALAPSEVERLLDENKIEPFEV